MVPGPVAHLIVRRPERDEVLFIDGALPAVDGTRVSDGIRALGLEAVVVRTQARLGDDRVLTTECLDAPTAPARGEWVSFERALGGAHGDVVAEWVAEEGGRIDVARPEWFRTGWITSMLAWLDGVLTERRRRRVGGLTQLKHWGLSAVVRVPTSAGDVVVKQTPSGLRAEGLTTAWLDGIAPGDVPAVIAVDGDRFVMDAFPVEVSHPLFDLPMWELWARDPAPARAAYLAAWGDADVLAAEWTAAGYLAFLYHAVMCATLADAMVDPAPKRDWAAAVQKLLLQALDAIDG